MKLLGRACIQKGNDVQKKLDLCRRKVLEGLGQKNSKSENKISLKKIEECFSKLFSCNRFKCFTILGIILFSLINCILCTNTLLFETPLPLFEFTSKILIYLIVHTKIILMCRYLQRETNKNIHFV